ncbi:MAG: hypothetical protein IKP46_06480 [Bacteroidales bacterium]|nr:hypothetical protein [Bacteroidales bacterium]
MKKSFIIALAAAVAAGLSSCEKVDTGDPSVPPSERGTIVLEEVAEIFASIPIGPEQMAEVRDAVASSTEYGYDEEYTMRSLFESPGTGVGETKASPKEYETPLRDLFRAAVEERFATRSGGFATRAGAPADADEYIAALTSSDVQIYWPYSELWSGSGSPVITYDPRDNSETNVGYSISEDGSVREIVVDEKTATERPVWVINYNDDSAFTSLELLRRQDPDWGHGGGEIIVHSPGTKASSDDTRTLILRSFKMNRHYDTWFAGASEFFVKCGSVNGFKATTEADMLLYSPTVTDFMIVVKRNQKGKEIPFNAVLISEWTNQLSSCAFLITEDDGGTQDKWKCSAVVKYNSKSYGFEIEIPINSRDDIVWRGQLTRSYVEKYSGETGHFGDVELVLELI